jgi:transposase
MSNPLSEEQRWGIVILKKHTSFSNSKISTLLNCSYNSVNNVFLKYTDTGNVSDKPRSGRPSIMKENSEDMKLIVNTIEDNRQSTCTEISKELRKKVHRIIQERNFRPVLYKRIPYLKKEHKKRRLEFAKDNSYRDWEEVIFTDEKLFSFSKRKVKIWKRPEEKRISVYVPSYQKKWMVWGGIWVGGRTKLHVFEANVNSEEYQNVIWEYLIEPQLDADKMFLQDNARPHVSASTRDFLKNFDIDVLDFPAMSPDLNAIEKVWRWMENHINHKKFNTSEDYMSLIYEAWNECPQQIIDNFILHNYQAIKTVKKLKGGNDSNI